MNRGDKLLCFYINVAFENIGFHAFSELIRLRERDLIYILFIRHVNLMLQISDTSAVTMKIPILQISNNSCMPETQPARPKIVSSLVPTWATTSQVGTGCCLCA